MNLAEKAKKHTAEMAVRYAEEINSAVANSVIYRDDSLPPLPANPNHSTKLGVLTKPVRGRSMRMHYRIIRLPY